MVMGELPSETEVLVIGGGPGGYAAAFRAADLGLDVTLVCDEERLGGTCLLRGCIPSKILLEITGLRYTVEAAAEHGLRFPEPELDLAALRQWKDDLVAHLSDGLDTLCQKRGIQRIQGRAHFTGGDRVHIEGGETNTISFRHAIIATGSRPRNIADSKPGQGSRVMDSTGALALEEVPGRLLVIGGGYVGLELGQVYASLGSQVTLVQSRERLLPQIDKDLVSILAKRIEADFETIHYETRTTKIHEEDDHVTVAIKGKDKDDEQQFDRVLMAVGRQPNTEELGLDKAGVETDDKGNIRIDKQCRTTAENIYAVGDVAGGIQLAHKAMYEGKVAAGMIAGKSSEADARAVPAVIYTEPQIATCGLTEEDMEQGMQVVHYPWSANGRALSLNAAEGRTKIIIEEESGRILGMGIVGPHAESLISEGTLAIELGAVAEDLAFTLHPHPTLSETVAEAAELYLGLATHFQKGD